MKAEQFVGLSDAEMDQVAGGASISLSLGEDGISLDTPIGGISVADPFTLIDEAAKASLGAVGDVLTAVGGALTKAGQLFDFS